MDSKDTRHVIAVTGDPTIDWAVMLPDHRCPTMEERLNSVATTHWHWGGALGLCQLVQMAVGNKAKVRGQEISKDILDKPSSRDNRFHHSYNIVQFFPLPEKKSEEVERRVRVREFLGFHAQHDGLGPLDQPKVDDNEELSLLLIDDAGFGFGNSENVRKSVFELAGKNDDAWIIVKLGTQVLKGDSALWQEISNSFGHEKRIIPIVTAASLREVGAAISRGLSWERSTQDVLAELNRATSSPHAALRTLAQYKRLVISFGPAGAFLVDRTEGPSRHVLYFHREFTEGTWEKSNDGGMFGYTQALAAAIARSLLKREMKLDRSGDGAGLNEAVSEGVHLGLSAMHAIRELGFHSQPFGESESRRKPGRMEFFNGCMSKKYKAKDQFESVRVPEPRLGSELPTWSILSRFTTADSLETKAVSVALQGRDKLKGVPVAKFNKLITADLHEIEGLRIVQNLIREYIDDRTKTKPRSIAVFGRPGDGKSFAVREVVESLYPDRKGGLTFNVSQFESVASLIAGLHQVRDRALEGEAPLVFWDEFDSNYDGTPLGWLPYFLSPMQDGTFQQGEIVHPVGRAIFVFAGGIFHRYADFMENAIKVKGHSKAGDFASRLQGYLDVVGPNPGPDQHEEEAGWMFHRALLLNHFLNDAGIGKRVNRDNEKELDVDEGVVRAFLGVGEYIHGARSMHAIVDTSRLHRGGKFGRSNLPHKTLLDLHVSGEQFLKIVRAVPPTVG
ncbi:hypothetical protein [Streptomyces sp. NL15-2K]|uniref:hypothetical protein n=1 Tax=Streptomyces sp. NL15-2K TaxID=376149 RepID=UPI000F55D445|nr:MULTISPECIES: hypothetical protein [Actinomycetes]WKX10533.1 hypothetical protein Q4V64_24700 [Kutzneria buriramensis]